MDFCVFDELAFCDLLLKVFYRQEVVGSPVDLSLTRSARSG